MPCTTADTTISPPRAADATLAAVLTVCPRTSPSVITTSPLWIPIRMAIRSGASGPEIARWMATALVAAAWAEPNESRAPSPRALITTPPWRSARSRMTPSCHEITSDHRRSPTDAAVLVDDSMSVNTSVAVP